MRACEPRVERVGGNQPALADHFDDGGADLLLDGGGRSGVERGGLHWKHGDRALVRRRRGGAEEKAEGDNHERNLTRETGVEKSDAGTAHRSDRRPYPLQASSAPVRVAPERTPGRAPASIFGLT